MKSESESDVHALNLLRVLIQIHDWEDAHNDELKTMSGRSLYFRLAASYLDDPKMPQQLKRLNGRLTERSTRNRMREFEQQGLMNINDSESDQRAKRAMPTKLFLKHLNDHLDMLKKMCDEKFVMLDKNC